MLDYFIVIFFILLLGTIYSILLDELIIGNTQRRRGPLNLGFYGILSSVVNGFNLLLSQFIYPKLHLHCFYQAFPIVFLLLSLASFNLIFPFFIVDLLLSLMLLLLFSGLSLILLFLLSYSGLSKYSMLGCLRLISQFVAYELVLTTLLVLLIHSYHSLTFSSIIFLSIL